MAHADDIRHEDTCILDGEKSDAKQCIIFSKDGLCSNIPSREVAPAMLRRCT